MNLKSGEINGTNRKMRKIGMILRCIRYKHTCHNKSTCKMTSSTQPIQSSQAIANEQPT